MPNLTFARLNRVGLVRVKTTKSPHVPIFTVRQTSFHVHMNYRKAITKIGVSGVMKNKNIIKDNKKANGNGSKLIKVSSKMGQAYRNSPFQEFKKSHVSKVPRFKKFVKLEAILKQAIHMHGCLNDQNAHWQKLCACFCMEVRLAIFHMHMKYSKAIPRLV